MVFFSAHEAPVQARWKNITTIKGNSDFIIRYIEVDNEVKSEYLYVKIRKNPNKGRSLSEGKEKEFIVYLSIITLVCRVEV